MDEERTVTGSVRGKLTRRFAAIGIGATLAACAIGYAIMWQWSASMGRNLTELRAGFESEIEVVNASTMNASATVARLLDGFMRERIADVQSWASGPSVVAAARQAHAAHEQAGLLALPVEEIEGKFQIRKSLGQFPIADDHLRAELFRSPYFERILFTDRNGYNVVVTNVSSDFVQSDEGWWQRTWSDGFTLSPVQYDEGMGAWSIDISVRIDDPATDKPVGVMQAALSIAPLQEITDRYVENEREERVTVVNSEGLLLAETSSGHSGARIMNRTVNVREEMGDARDAVFGVERTGYVTDGEWVTGYTRTADGEFYADLTRGFRFGGFQWGVIAQSRQVAPSAGIEAVVESLAGRRGVYAGILAGGALVLVLIAGGTGWWAAGEISRPIRELRTMAQQVSLGSTTREVKMETNDELSEIADAFDRMRRSVQVMIRMIRSKRAQAQPPGQ